jgi:hypothetical protein
MSQGVDMSAFILSRVASRIIALILFFEPLVPVLISLFLKVEFMRLRHSGSVDGYRFKVNRLGKLFYEMKLHVVMNPQQAQLLLKNVVTQILTGLT